MVKAGTGSVQGCAPGERAKVDVLMGSASSARRSLSVYGGRTGRAAFPRRAGPPHGRRGGGKRHGRIGTPSDPLRNGMWHIGLCGPVQPPRHDDAVALKLCRQGRGSPAQQVHAVPELLWSHGQNKCQAQPNRAS